MKIYNFTDKALLTKKDANQMTKAIEAFKTGEEQPQGRFVILKELKQS